MVGFVVVVSEEKKSEVVQEEIQREKGVRTRVPGRASLCSLSLAELTSCGGDRDKPRTERAPESARSFSLVAD